MARHQERAAGSRLEDGSYRPSRHGPLDATAPHGAPIPAARLRLPQDLPQEMRPLWRATIEELKERGLLHGPDLETLADGFRQLAIARALQRKLAAALEEPDTAASELGKLQTAYASASSAAARVFAAFGVGAPLPRARVKALAPAKRPAGNGAPARPSINEIIARARKEKTA